jgi:hypothetical protein
VLKAILILSIGFFLIVAGEADDSPGLQGIGLLLIIWQIWTRLRSRRIRG